MCRYQTIRSYHLLLDPDPRFIEFSISDLGIRGVLDSEYWKQTITRGCHVSKQRHQIPNSQRFVPQCTIILRHLHVLRTDCTVPYPMYGMQKAMTPCTVRGSRTLSDYRYVFEFHENGSEVYTVRQQIKVPITGYST